MKSFKQAFVLCIILIISINLFGPIVWAEEADDSAYEEYFNSVGSPQTDENVSSYTDSKIPIALNTAKKIGDWVYITKSTYNYGLSRVDAKTNKPIAFSDTTKSFQTSGQWVYYTNASDNNKLYRVMNDGSKKSKLTDLKIKYFSILGDWIVYIDINKSNSLYKMKSDGSNVEALGKISSVKEIKAFDSFIVYTTLKTPRKTYSVKLDGSKNYLLANQDLLSDKSIYFSNGYLYYNDQQKKDVLTKNKLDGTAKPTVITNEKSSQSIINKEWIYYVSKTNNYQLYKIKNDGTGKKLIYNTPTSSFRLNGDFAYCKSKKTNSLTKVNIQNSSKQKMCDFNGTDFEIAKNTIFFRDSLMHKFHKVIADGKSQVKNATLSEFAIASDTTSNKWLWYTDNHQIDQVYKLNDATGQKVTLVEGKYYTYYLYKNILYYCNESSIYINNLDTKQIKVINVNGILDDLIVYKNYICFRRSEGLSSYLCSMNLDGTSLKSFEFGLDKYYINGEFVYYQTNESVNYTIYRFNIRTGAEEQMSPQMCQILTVTDKYLFFSKLGSNTVYSLSLKDKKMKLLLYNETFIDDNNNNWLYVYNDWIYYSNSLDEGNLYKVNPDNGTKLKVLNKYIVIEAIKNDWIIYFSDLNVYRKVKIDGTDDDILGSGNVYMNDYTSDTMYYTKKDTQGFFSTIFNTNVAQKETKLTDLIGPLEKYFIAGDYIYYIDSSVLFEELYRIKIGTNIKEKL